MMHLVVEPTAKRAGIDINGKYTKDHAKEDLRKYLLDRWNDGKYSGLRDFVWETLEKIEKTKSNLYI